MLLPCLIAAAIALTPAPPPGETGTRRDTTTRVATAEEEASPWPRLEAHVLHGTTSDTIAARQADSTPGSVSSSLSDTLPPRRRPRAIEVSEGYETRLRIHRYASYTMIPLFVMQAVAGEQLYRLGGPPPSWARPTHRFGRTAIATVFGVNTVTGVWNAWETRHNPAGRGRRLLHGALMLASDAGFTYAGVKLSKEATRSLEGRRRHRTWAYGSMAVATTGYGIMLFGNH